MDPKLPAIRQLKLLTMWVAHELGETGPHGDITPVDGITLEEKRRMEMETFEVIVKEAPDALHLYELWQEFETGETEDARFVLQIDKLEAVLQSLVEQRRWGIDASEFFNRADSVITHPRLRPIFVEARSYV